MKNKLLLIMALTITLSVYAETDCDIILTSDNFQIPCVITHVSESDVQYGKCPTTIETIFAMPISKIKKIYLYSGIVLDYTNGNVPVIPENVGRTITLDADYVTMKIDTTPNTHHDEILENQSLLEDTIITDTPIDVNNVSKKDTIQTLISVNEGNDEDENVIQVENTFVESSYILSELELKQKSLAEVHKYAGIFIFNDNEPICDYMVFGRVKVSVSWSSEYEGVRNQLVNKALKKFPQADAVILNLSDGGSDMATIIKFTNSDEKKKWGYAKVNSFNGLYVYSNCTPINNYTITGRCKSVITWSGQYDSVKANLIKRALKKIPNAQGIILNMQRGGVDRGVVIEF